LTLAHFLNEMLIALAKIQVSAKASLFYNFSIWLKPDAIDFAVII